MPRPGEDRSDVGAAAQFNNIVPVPLSAFSCPAFRFQFNNIVPVPLSAFLERMIDRPPRSVAAQKLIEELQKQVQKTALDDRDKKSLVDSLGELRKQSPRTALLALVDRINQPPTICGMHAREFLSKCVGIRNSIAHDARLDDSIDLAKLSDGLRHFIMSLIWTMNHIPDVSVNVPASTVQLDSLEMRMI